MRAFVVVVAAFRFALAEIVEPCLDLGQVGGVLAYRIAYSGDAGFEGR